MKGIPSINIILIVTYITRKRVTYFLKLTLKLGLIFEICRTIPTVQSCLYWYLCHILKLLDPRSQGYVLPNPWKQFFMSLLCLIIQSLIYSLICHWIFYCDLAHAKLYLTIDRNILNYIYLLPPNNLIAKSVHLQYWISRMKVTNVRKKYEDVALQVLRTFFLLGKINERLVDWVSWPNFESMGKICIYIIRGKSFKLKKNNIQENTENVFVHLHYH